MGENALIVRDRLGHADVRTTLDVYGLLYPKSDAEAAKRLEGLLDVPPEWKSAGVCQIGATSKPKADKSMFVSL